MLKRIIILMISTIVWGIDSLGKAIYSVFSKNIPGRCVVLYYHDVTNDQHTRFFHQMEDIARLAKPISVNTNNSLDPGKYHVAVTFDDGFQSIDKKALPELAHRHIPCTIFVPTGHIGKKPAWLKNKNRDGIRHNVMDADMLRKISENDLFSIGSHCISHSSLTSMSYDDAKKEIYESKKCLENILNEKIKTISFPHGAYNHIHVELAREAGYKRVFTITPSLAFVTSDEYITGRVKTDPTDWVIEFRLKLFGAYRWLPAAYRLKKAIKSLQNHR
ncbi:MAG: polysaccharide deacetylase family protein [Clostridiales bacterium]|nr:polysaccharide deacetylase family protein [Clostridiales bacterium]